ncbi:helical backbone metal receptor [bacterium]|nr:helical backbone metal receptor [bacterium]
MSIRIFTDQLQNQVKLKLPLQRIISLVPSQTELLYDLGLGDRVVGITKFCVHPKKWHQAKTIVGGTKKFNLDVIAQLQPDLIIGNKEENYEEGIDALQSKYPVWVSDIYSLQDALNMIQSIGEMTETEPIAQPILRDIKNAFSILPIIPSRSVLYLIWRDPWMAVGTNTFIHAMLETIGWRNAISESRYPEINTSVMQAISPEIILLPSEPFPFKDQHRDELQPILPSSKIIRVDGEMFSWYGSRLVKAPEYFKKIADLF